MGDGTFEAAVQAADVVTTAHERSSSSNSRAA